MPPAPFRLPLLVLAGSLFARLADAQPTPLAPLNPRWPAVLPLSPEPAGGSSQSRRGVGVVEAKPSPALPAARPAPVFLVNGRFLVSGSLASLAPQDIETLHVYKGNSAPPAWVGLAQRGGLISLTLKHKLKLKSQSFRQLSRALKLVGPVQLELDGLPVSDPSLRLVQADIVGLDLRRSAAHTVLNVRLLPHQPTPRPGVYVRGVAGR